MVAGMERRRVAWLLSLALTAVGGLLAHALTYRLASPAGAGAHAHPHSPGRPHPDSVHPALAHWQACLAVCAAVALVALAASLVMRLRGHPAVAPPVWLFALFPPVGFVVQEQLERLFAGGGALLAADTAVVVGVLLQIPFALAAYLAARALVALAAALVETVRARSRTRLAPLSLARPVAACARRPIASALALGHGQRAPPVPAV